MKALKTLSLVLVMTISLSSCNFFRNIFHKQEKHGCPSSGYNVGAEKLLDDGYKPKNKEERKAIKMTKKADKKKAKKNPYML